MPLASFCEIPLSDAYRHLLCKRSYLDASGILFMLANPIFNLSSLIFHLNASGIILLATPIFNLSSLIFHLDASGIFFANDHCMTLREKTFVSFFILHEKIVSLRKNRY
jgi:hypothetical protein